MDNEPIDDDFIIYRYHLTCLDKDEYVGIRIVTKKNELSMIAFTIGNEYEKLIKPNLMESKEDILYNKQEATNLLDKEKNAPPGQRFIPSFIIYRILGQPDVRIDEWVLRITGNVERELTYTYEELLKMDSITVKEDFHCVTGWSVRSVEWSGVPLRKFVDEAKVKPSVKWVYVVSLDGYTTIIPYEDLVSEKSILALKMNGKPLSLEQGFPARIIIPHLYGWKSAKWVKEIVFMDNYVDGYWEALGYHWRGNVFLNERFKEII